MHANYKNLTCTKLTLCSGIKLPRKTRGCRLFYRSILKKRKKRIKLLFTVFKHNNLINILFDNWL